ncbi:N-acetylglucosaminyl-phosphatidylinositol de-N-acetylase [Pimephales promelas]|nr:N-acetylglucosaminyl-phosphatidylinositol de-N-acetylase [Pimephales promelas]
MPATNYTCGELPDDPAVQWSTALVSSLILKHTQNYGISLVLTFDGRGVSGHANHIAIYKTLRYLCADFTIHTTGCWRLLKVYLQKKSNSYNSLGKNRDFLKLGQLFDVSCYN